MVCTFFCIQLSKAKWHQTQIVLINAASYGNLTVITRCRLRTTHHYRPAGGKKVFRFSSADSHYLLQKIVVEFFYSVFYEVRHLGMDVFSFGNDVGRQFDISQFCLCNESTFEVIESGFDDKEP